MKFEDGQAVGIDLGTSYSAIAHLDEQGVPVVLENRHGQIITPSVLILGDGGQVQVGPTPEEMTEAAPERVITGIKRHIGETGFSLQHEGRRLTPELISAMILTRLKQDAEKTLETARNAVITVPYYFNEPRRLATRNAGRIAGFNVLDIINEPTAATLAWAWQKGELGNPDLPDIEKTLLVYDLGGGTFDVTLVRCTPSEFQVIATDGDTMLGGLDWTQRLTGYLAEQFEKKFGLDPRSEPDALKRLTIEAESAKREICLFGKSKVTVPFHHQKLHLEVDLTTFEHLTADLLQRTIDTTEFLLETGQVRPDQLDEVLLVGGSSAMPAVSARLKKLCRREPSRELNPQAAVAQGAAIHGAILQARSESGRGRMSEALRNRLRSVVMRDVNSHSLGVEITDPRQPSVKRNHIMIPRNSRLPVHVKQRFVTTTDNPRAIHVRLLEGDAPDSSACTFVGDFRLTSLPERLPKGSPVEIEYGFTERGQIQVLLRELTSQRQTRVEIAWNQGLNDSEIDVLTDLLSHFKCG